MYARLILLLFFFTPLAQSQERPPASVVTATITSKILSPTSEMVGVLRFAQVSNVAAEVEGVIETQHFDTGWSLKKGTIMAQLNTDFIQKDRGIIQSQILEADAEIEKLAREVKRLEALKQGQLTSRSTYDEAFFSHKVLQARKKTLQAKLGRIQLSIDKSKVRAPFDGIVLEKLGDQGNWLGKGDALARFGSTQDIQAIIPVSERLLPFQQSGDTFEVTIPALKLKISGQLTGIVPFAELRSKSVYLKISLPYEEGMIEHLTVESHIPTAAPRKLLLIPRAALLQNQGADTVYTIVDGKATPVIVDIVSRRGGFITVAQGDLKSGATVIVDGNDRLQPGQAVQVVVQ
ncbi:MAG: efflux RND transporter periplasmic adaptor subunit [Candidatus Polarisedimenticolaceae bacterium]|nr:efflux RND transporter periplasmic adaptor subunit [Candidatus Polarisedimenticolaceae bacterium]